MKNNLIQFIYWVLLGWAVSNNIYGASQSGWKITSDSSVHDYAKQILSYSGNAVLTTEELTVHGEQINALKSDGEETSRFQISGSPVKLLQNRLNNSQTIELSAAKVDYQMSDQKITAQNKIILVQKNASNDFFEARGDTLLMYSSPKNLLNMAGSPLQIVISQSEQEPMQATALQMNYSQDTQKFELIGDVVLSNSRETIRAQKIFYDSKTRVLQIPKDAKQQVEMTQTKKDN